MLRRAAILALLCCWATLAQAAVRDCTPADGRPGRLAGDPEAALKVLRCLHGTDRSGAWQLYLLGNEDRHDGDHAMSTRLAAELFTRQPDGTFVQRWLLRDRIAPDEAGAWFSRKLSEFEGLDADGTVAPLLVLRFVSWKGADPRDGANEDFDAGRLKLVLPGGAVPATVTALTGTLDDERRTTANDAYFTLPEATRRHVQQLLRQWNHDQVFLSADNGGTFAPRREKKR
jgi:hypothetical protein